MKRVVGFVSVCCVFGLVAVPALGQTIALVPAGADPAGAPYAITAGGGDPITVEVFVRDSGVPVQSIQSSLFCEAGGGSAGSVDNVGKLLDEGRADYIFDGVTTFGPGGVPKNCPDQCGGTGAGSLSTGILAGPSPTVTDWKYMGEWNLSVSSDAEGTFVVRFVCSDCPAANFCDPDQNAGAGCTATLTFIGDDLAACIPIPMVHPLTITVPTGDCCVGQACTQNVTQWECENTLGGSFREDGDCSQSCECLSDADCDDGLACTDDVCAGLGAPDAGPDGCTHDATVCPADTDCTSYACVEPAGCTATNFAAGTICTGDGDDCTVDECDGNGNCTHPQIDCDDSDICTADSCTPGVGCVHPPSGECTVDVCLDVEPTNAADCVPAGAQILVKMNLGETSFDLVGFQGRVEFDASQLALKSATVGADCDPASPFAESLGQKSGEGWVAISTNTALISCATDADCPAGHPCSPDSQGNLFCEKTGETSNGGVAAACLYFEQIGEQCGKSQLCYADDNPWQLLVVDVEGNMVPISAGPTGTCDCDAIIPDTPIELIVPDDVNVNSDCDKVTAVVEWAAPEAIDKCGDLAPVMCSCEELWGGLGGCEPEWLMNNGGIFPQGTYLFECLAQDNQCGDTASGSWTVTVSDQTSLYIDIELSPNMADKELIRGIEFEAFSSCSPLKTDIFCRDIAFGPPWHLPGKFQGELKIPKGQYECLSARDSLHTLRASSDIECGPEGSFTAIFKNEPPSGNWLIGGNLDGNNYDGKPRAIDILDYALFVSMFLNVVPQDTPCDDKGMWDDLGGHGDINGDGIVDDADFTFIAINFMEEDKDVCCPGGRTAPDPGLTEISVRELIKMGLGHLAVADLNGDGMVDMDDMAAFMGGSRPKDRPGIGSGR